MTQPNILFIMADQLIADLAGAYGHRVVQTPTLDRLAEGGVRFDAAYTPVPTMVTCWVSGPWYRSGVSMNGRAGCLS